MNPLATVVDEVTGSIQGAPAVFYMLQGAGGRLAVVYAESRESANELCRQLEALDASRGSWRHAAPMVKRSVLWPVWLRQAEEVRQLGERLRGGAPLLRFMEEALDPERGVSYAAECARDQLYGLPPPRPYWEEPSEDVALGGAFDAEPLDIPALLKLATQLSTGALDAYMFWSMRRFDTTANRTAIGAAANAELRGAGLLITAREAPFDVLLRHLPPTVLYQPIKAWKKRTGQDLESHDFQAYRHWYAAHLPEIPGLELELRSSAWLLERTAFMPPPGLTWDQLQDLSLAYARMLRELASWLAGKAVGPLGQTHFAGLA